MPQPYKAEQKPDKPQPNPAGHLRGNQRPEGMTDEQWEAERDRVNRERFVERHGREPGPEDDVEDTGDDPAPQQ